MTKLNYPQINRDVDNLINIVWIKCAYKKIYYLKNKNIPVKTGKFQAMMDVELINDGPVTFWLEK